MSSKRLKKIIRIIFLQEIIAGLEKKTLEIRERKENAIDKMFAKFEENKESREDYVDHVSGEERRAFNKAADLRKQEQKALMTKRAFEILQKSYVWILIAILILFTESFNSDLGSKISIDYYSALSQIFPIILIALYMASTRTKITRRLFKINYQTLRLVTVISDGFHGITSVIIGTVTCLFAIASNSSSTFGFLITISCLVMVMFALLQNLAQD